MMRLWDRRSDAECGRGSVQQRGQRAGAHGRSEHDRRDAKGEHDQAPGPAHPRPEEGVEGPDRRADRNAVPGAAGAAVE